MIEEWDNTISKIRNLMRLRKINSKELAEKCNCNPATISRIINGKVELTKKMKKRIALALEVDVEYLEGKQSEYTKKERDSWFFPENNESLYKMYVAEQILSKYFNLKIEEYFCVDINMKRKKQSFYYRRADCQNIRTKEDEFVLEEDKDGEIQKEIILEKVRNRASFYKDLSMTIVYRHEMWLYRLDSDMTFPCNIAYDRYKKIICVMYDILKQYIETLL